MTRFLPLLVLSLLSMATPAAASLVCHEPAVVTVELLSGDQRLVPDLNLARYYPDRAARREAEGEVQLDCNPGGCQVTREDPVDDSFGEGAIKAVKAAGLLAEPRSIRVVFRVVAPPGKEIPCKP